jgi:ATP-binding cassette, subfamily B, multidrug efflux pump
MPDGFASLIAQGGINVSGGQKQRLSIARALVRKPEIYVFDDSFSALDFKTDARLRAALKNETRDATVFIVAQRVGTVMDADRIIVLDEGHIAGIGTHRELLETSDVYREIVSSQLSSAEIEEGIA